MDPSYEVTFNGEGTGEQIFDLIQIWFGYPKYSSYI
jgi:hypothetical protein